MPRDNAPMSTPHAPSRETRIALLIDADNSPAAKIDLILAELAKLGVANIRRAYGNWKKNELKGWEKVLHECAIRPIQQFDVSKGKNATDMLIAIDAMDLLYTDRPDAFGIVSSDADFTPLVMHLHCPEMAAPFVAVWYLLGMLIPAAVGALIGKRLLRW